MKKNKFILLIILILSSINLFSQEPSLTIEQKRAHWILHTANATTWPNQDTIDCYIIGICSSMPEVQEELEKLAPYKSINGKPIRIVRFSKIRKITYTHVLYLGTDKKLSAERVARRIDEQVTLFITDQIENTELSMCNFLPDGQSQALEFNTPKILEKGLKIDDDAISYAGSKKDIKSIYNKKEKLLDSMERVSKEQAKLLDQQEERITEQINTLEKQKDEIKDQKKVLAEQNLKIQLSDSALKRKEQNLKQAQVELKYKTDLVEQKEEELTAKKKELKTKEDILTNTRTEIEEKQNQLKNLEKSIEKAKNNLTRANSKIETQKVQIYTSIGVILSFLGLLIFLLKLLRKNRKMNKQLTTQNTEINQQKDQIEEQSNELKSKNKELEQLSIVAENAQNAILILDKDGNAMWVNPGFTKMYGYTLQLLINERDKNIRNSSYNSDIASHIDECISEKNNVTFQVKAHKRDGTSLWVKTTLTPIIDDDNEIEKIVVIDTDITEIIRAEHKIVQQSQELQQTNKELEKLSIVVEKTDNSALITNDTGYIEWVNQAFVDTFGTLEEYKAQRGGNFITGIKDFEAKDKIKDMYRFKKPITFNQLAINNKQEKIWLQANLTPVLDENNNISKIIIVNADISALKEAQQIITEKNLALTEQKEKIEVQNDKINSSIAYAQTIQQSILPIKAVTEKYFKSEIIFKPKDVVSGDFYWFHPIKGKNIIFAAAVDCTGHGVPGAFMSIISNRILTDIVANNNEITPDEILEKTDRQIIKALRQDYTKNNDGLDIALCKIQQQEDNFNVLYAGAKRNLYYHSQEDNKIHKLIGTRRSIGGVNYRKKMTKFTTSEINLLKGDILYLTTDGYTDQNDKNRKKFGSSKFINLLEQVCQKDISEQYKIINQTLETHMSETDQRDDITVWIIQL